MTVLEKLATRPYLHIVFWRGKQLYIKIYHSSISLRSCTTKEYWQHAFGYDNGDTIYHELNDECVIFVWGVWHRIMTNITSRVRIWDNNVEVPSQNVWKWVFQHADAYAFHLKLLGYHHISDERYLPACVGLYGYPARKISTGVPNPLYKYKEVIAKPLPSGFLSKYLPHLQKQKNGSRHILHICNEFHRMLTKPLSELSLYV